MLEIKNIDLNYKDEMGRALLSVAAESSHLESLELLIKAKGLDLDYKDNYAEKLLRKQQGLEIIKWSNYCSRRKLWN